MSMIEQAQDSQRIRNAHAADALRYFSQPSYFASNVKPVRRSVFARLRSAVAEARYRLVNAWWFLRHGYSRYGED